MSWTHRLGEVNVEARTAVCAACGPTTLHSRGGGRYRCSTPSNTRRGIHRQYVGDLCVRCGFIPEDMCQLDVDHINRDHSDNRPENLQTLCANCHRLKTKKER